ncbi:patatin-like phospholipase family protein [Ruegeria marisrubri]|nr:patatin-like phospholipase family protein [Ruegeria marisrubri]
MTEGRSEPPEVVSPEFRFWADDSSGALAAHLPSGKPVRDVLVLSGGGPDGAFGAGVLSGWTQSGKRPSFDVVTGVSIGAIIAPYAFLGPDYDDRIEDLVLNRTGKLKRPELKVSGLLLDAGAFERNALANLVQTILTPDVVAKIAREHRSGRRLFVATTELDSQRVSVWDIGAMAQLATPEAVRAIRGVFVAAAAIPAAFTPVQFSVPSSVGLQDELHADAGVITQFWAPDPRVVRRLGGAGPTYHIIVNNLVEADFEVVQPDAASLSKRAFTTVFRSALHADLALTETLLGQAGGRMSLAYIPPDWPVAAHALDFNQDHMQELYGMGRQAGRSQSIWVSRVPESYRTLPH